MKNHDLEQLLKNKYVNSKQMLMLVKKYQWTKKPEHKLVLRDEIFNNNIRFIRKIVIRSVGANSEDLEDVFNSAVIEFFNGLDKFDTKTGNSLSTYISHWIERAVHNYYYGRHIVHIPRASFSETNKFFGNAKIAANGSLLYLDAPIINTDGKHASIHDVVEDKRFENLEEVIVEKLHNEHVYSAIEKLSETEREIINYKFFSEQEMPVKEIAEKCGVSKSRVSQHLHSAFRKLRRIVNEPERLEEFNRKFGLSHQYAPETDFEFEMRLKYAIPRRTLDSL